MPENEKNHEAVLENNPSQPAKLKKKKPRQETAYNATLTSESLAALFDRGHLVIEAADLRLKLKLDAFDLEEDLENLESARDDLNAIIDDLSDEDDDDDDDFEDEEIDDEEDEEGEDEEDEEIDEEDDEEEDEEEDDD